MKSIFARLFNLIFVIISACTVNNDAAPDVTTDLTQNFLIQIRSNTGETEPQFIDVSSSPDYNEFKNNIGGFEINKITFRIKNYNAPQDMYLNGTLICSNEEETETYTIGSVSKANLAVMEAESIENTLVQAPENTDKILNWLVSPGRFKARSGYTFTNADGTPFTIQPLDIGTNFILVVTFHVTVKTKV